MAGEQTYEVGPTVTIALGPYNDNRNIRKTQNFRTVMMCTV